MTSRERLRAVLNHKEADRIPLDLGAGKCCKFHIGMYKKLLDYFGIKDKTIRIHDKESQSVFACDELLEKLECDVRIPYWLLQGIVQEEWEDEEYWYMRNEWRTVSRMPKKGALYYDAVEFPFAGIFDSDEELNWDYPPPRPITPDLVSQAKAYHEAGYPVVAEHYGFGMLQNGSKLFGYEDCLMMFASEDERVIQHMEKELAGKMKHWDNVAEAFGPDGIDVVCESDDLGTQSGPFIAPTMFRNLIKPYYKKLFDHIHKKLNAKIFLHSDGSIVDLLPDLIEIGVDILNPVQASAKGMDPSYLKKEFGKDLVFWGAGIDTQRTLPAGSPAQIRDEVKRNIDTLAPGGGFVFAAVHNVQSDVPVENFIAMWEAFKEFRNY
jgi:uroporphyrinogen decarboxylase